jgi:two-component system chemotaxis response regulator CheB
LSKDETIKTKISSKINFQKSISRSEAVGTPNLTPVRDVLINSNIIVIGASVGGPRTITTILKELPANINAPILIVQHLSSHFTEAFVDNLDIECKLRIKIAENGESLLPGTCYIAPGDNHMEINVANKKPYIKIYKGKPVNFCMPSIDLLFLSAARIYRNRAMGIILTGMGSDGVEGLGTIKKFGGHTIAESEETSILYAMPKFAAEKGYAQKVLPNHEIYQEITNFVQN